MKKKKAVVLGMMAVMLLSGCTNGSNDKGNAVENSSVSVESTGEVVTESAEESIDESIDESTDVSKEESVEATEVTDVELSKVSEAISVGDDFKIAMDIDIRYPADLSISNVITKQEVEKNKDKMSVKAEVVSTITGSEPYSQAVEMYVDGDRTYSKLDGNWIYIDGGEQSIVNPYESLKHTIDNLVEYKTYEGNIDGKDVLIVRGDADIYELSKTDNFYSTYEATEGELGHFEYICLADSYYPIKLTLDATFKSGIGAKSIVNYFDNMDAELVIPEEVISTATEFNAEEYAKELQSAFDESNNSAEGNIESEAVESAVESEAAESEAVESSVESSVESTVESSVESSVESKAVESAVETK